MTDPGERFAAAVGDRYTIERELGRGGMATVYLADDVKLRRKVAVKVLRPDLAETLGAERFLREIEVAAALTHPNILPLHDSGVIDGFLFYIMPVVEGETLRARLQRERQLSLNDTMSIVRDIASALESAHRRGIVHRDIKPENILLHEGRAIVADFGLALAVTAVGGGRLTDTGIAVGTPTYMSPEQGAGDTHLDARSDIYSLGCVVYEMLAGEPPFTGPTAQALLAKRMTETPISLQVVRETVSSGVDSAVQKALAKAPADRFASAELFAQELARASKISAAADGAEPAPDVVAPEMDVAPPFRGLRYFDVEHAHLFFGRDREIEELLARLRGKAFLTVVGDSGSGKSSLVRAGLVPALLAGRSADEPEGSASWRIAICRPGDDPFRELANALPDLDPELSPTDRIRTRAECARQLVGGPAGLAHCIGGVASRGDRTLLVVDQFEELFTLTVDPTVRRRFIDVLLTAAQTRGDRPIHVLITLRADFYSRCWEHPDLPNRMAANQYAVRRVETTQLEDIIEKPLATVGARCELGLVAAVLNDVGDEPGNLPLLQHALALLWDKRTGRTLTHAAYEEIGRVAGAVAHHADQILGSLDRQQQDLARKIFLRLTRPGEGTEDTRRRARRADILALGGGDLAGQVLARLVAGRLVTASGGPGARAGEDMVEVTHEALIREWPALRRWITHDREALRISHALETAAADWDSHQRHQDYLYHGARLAQAEEWGRDNRNDLTPLQSAFLDASVAARDREARDAEAHRKLELQLARRAKKMSRFLGVVTVLTVLVGAVAGQQWFLATQRERLSTSRELAAAALNNLERDPELSVLLAAAALDEAVTNQAEFALHRALHQSRIRLTRRVHTDRITSVTFSPDGQRLATASWDGTAKIWDAATGEETVTLRGHTSSVDGVAFSPDGRWLATASWDSTARVWSATSGEEILTLRRRSAASGGPGPQHPVQGVRGVVFSPDGTRLATASWDSTATVWAAASGQEMLTISGHGGHVNSVAFSPDGQRLATASTDGTARLWDATSGAEVLLLRGDADGVRDVAFNPDGTRIAAANTDGTVQLWDADSGEEIVVFRGHTQMVRDLSFSADGRRIATASDDQTAKLWDVGSGQEIMTLSGHERPVTGVAISPDGRGAATSSWDETVRVWEIAAGGEMVSLTGHAGAVMDVTFSPDGTRLATASRDSTAKVWTADSGEALVTLRGHAGAVTGVVFSADGERVATASDDRTARVWDLTLGGEIVTLRGHTGVLDGIAFSPDGMRLATASWDSTAKVWDLASGEEVFTLSGDTREVTDVVFSPDGTLLATATGPDRVATVWDAATGEEIVTLTGHPGTLARVAFSPDGAQLATASADWTAKVWAIPSADELLTLRGHANWVWSVAFSPDGTRLATASSDHTAKVWDAVTGEEIATLGGHAAEVFALSFSSDGTRLATASRDRTARVFPVGLDLLKDLAQQRVTRSMTDVECQTFLHVARCPSMP